MPDIGGGRPEARRDTPNALLPLRVLLVAHVIVAKPEPLWIGMSQLRSSRRRILPTFVFGSSVRKSMCFGRL